MKDENSKPAVQSGGPPTRQFHGNRMAWFLLIAVVVMILGSFVGH